MTELIDLSSKWKESAAQARVHLKTPELIVHPTVDRQAGQIEKTFHKAGKKVNSIYLDLTNNLWELCNGRLSFDEIMAKMQSDHPAAVVWSAADFLLQNKMIKFSRLRVSTHTDGSVDQQLAAAASAQAKAALPGGTTQVGAALPGGTAQVGTAAAAAAAAAGAAPAGNSGFVSLPKACVACKMVDALSQKYCVHCGAEMVTVKTNE